MLHVMCNFTTISQKPKKKYKLRKSKDSACIHLCMCTESTNKQVEGNWKKTFQVQGQSLLEVIHLHLPLFQDFSMPQVRGKRQRGEKCSQVTVTLVTPQVLGSVPCLLLFTFLIWFLFILCRKAALFDAEIIRVLLLPLETVF